MAKKTPAATDNAQDSAQKQPEAAIAPQSESAPQASSTLPFAQKREELIKKFRANAVPREADYKQLLDQHYDVAGALGMANSDDNNGGKTGKGLVFENEKLHVKAKATGGLLSDTNGVSLVTGSSLVIGTDNKVNVNISGKNGLKISEDGEVGVKLFSQDDSENSENVAAVIVNNPNPKGGLWINVGSGAAKKGLNQYKNTGGYNAILGVSHDGTLKIDSSTGKLGVMPHASGGLITSGSGLMLNTSGMSGLKVEDNALKMVTGSTLVIGTDNTVNVKTSNKNGLKISTGGEVEVNLYSYNSDSDSFVAAVISHNPTDISGLGVNVGGMGSKKGLKQYKSTSSAGAVLGVSHDNTLTINNTGQLGVNVASLPVTGASSPLTVSGGKITLNHDSSLTVSSDKLGVNGYSVIPRGTIVMFHGSAIPDGWKLCDGNNGTPDLVGKFLKASSKASTSGNTGGSDKVKYTPGGSVVINGTALDISQIPAHSHGQITTNIYDSSYRTAAGNAYVYMNSRTEHLSTTTQGGGKSHNHTGSFNGESVNIDILPPYYEIAYIMKT